MIKIAKFDEKDYETYKDFVNSIKNSLKPNGELYVFESQAAPYWPRTGIQKNKFDDWIQWAHNADFNAVLLPLREEYRNKLDVDKANKWFTEEAEGQPYGYHNFIFTWIDKFDFIKKIKW